MTAFDYDRVLIRPDDARIVVRAQGPTGASGGAASAYVHTQGSAASTWTIAHNLGFYPDAAVFTTGGIEVVAEVAHLSLTVLEVRFAAPMAGTARLT